MSHSSQEKMGNYNADGKKEHKLMRKGLAVALAGAVALGAAGCSGDKVGAKAPEVKPSTTTEAPVAPEKEAETTEKQTNTEEYTQDMEFYKQMGVEEFEELPIEERLKYAQFLSDQLTQRGVYDEFYKSRVEFIEPINVSKDNAGIDIFNSFERSIQMAYLQYIEGDYNPKPIDVSDGQKLLSANFLNIRGDGYMSAEHKSLKDLIGSLAEPSAFDYVLAFKQTLGEDVSTGTYNGETLYYRDILARDTSNGNDVYQRYVYREFISYDGEEKGAWVLEWQELSEALLYSGSALR